jgi:hypothetical protein
MSKKFLYNFQNNYKFFNILILKLKFLKNLKKKKDLKLLFFKKFNFFY